MKVSDILSIILVGLVIGVLGRLVLPGRQQIGAFATFVVGMVAAAIGYFAARALGINHHAPVQVWRIHWDWYVLLIQVILAVILVAIANSMTYTRLADGGRVRRSSTRRKSASRS